MRVHAAAITRHELEWPSGRLPAIPSHGLSGVVVEDSDGFSAGGDVFALAPLDRDGVAADYALVPVEEGEPCDLLFDTVGCQALARSAGQAGRIVTIAAEAPGAHYFVVEPNHEQLLELARLVDTGDLWSEVDSVFPLAQAVAAWRGGRSG